MNFPTILTALCLSLCTLGAEVRSVTIGIDVNSPYGIGEPWVMIREGLLRLENIEFVSPEPDRRTTTGELRTKGGRLPDVEALGKSIREIGAGASLRGVEVTVDGRVEKTDDQLVLRVSKTDEVLVLEPATKRIQLQRRKKSSEPLTEAEQKAFQNLSAKWQGRPLDVRITGPINKRGGKAVLGVRRFDFQAVPERETTK